ncbi:WD40-repeat-containing domain protein [Chlamydoabsidia padenii]|nr:WD40-repeat-containing domain protein [Chlamydoabsidia padenii]
MDDKRLDKVAAFPPGPNWYSSYTALTTDDFYVYASKNFIVILHLHSLSYRSSFSGALEKINAIDAHTHLCFVAGKDPVIRLWNLLDGSLLTVLQPHKAEVTALKCLREGTVVISGDKTGCIIVQETSGTKSQQYLPVKSEITAMALVNHENTDYIAIGYLNGIIMVYSVGDDLKLKEKSQLLHTNDAINSLSWQVFNDQANSSGWPSLASGGKRTKDVLVWQVIESSISHTIKLPKTDNHLTAQQKNTNWIHLTWSPLCSTEIYITSHAGQILRYNISGSKVSQISPRFEQCHSRIAFSLCFASTYHIITYSLDGQIVKWNLRDGKPIMTIKTQSGFPYSLDISPNTPDHIIIGYGDSNIKLWEYHAMDGIISKPGGRRTNFYESTNFWKGLRGQVEKILWHPTIEGMAAYSTEYGHVGLYDVFNNKNLTFKEYHSVGVAPSLAWAGDLSFVLAKTGVAEFDTMTDTLITCGEKGGLFLRNVGRPHQNPISFSSLLATINPDLYTLLETKKAIRTFVATSPSFKYLALGNSDGSMEIYSLESLKVIYSSNYHRKPISCFHWKDLDSYSLVASGCHDGDIAIHKIHHKVDINPTALPTTETSPFGSLNAHKQTITCLRWSHHIDQSILASTSMDNLAIVWNIEPTPTVVGCFEKHCGRVYSVCWQYLEPDVLLTGGEDRFIYMWNWKNYTMTMDNVKKITTSRLLREKKRLIKRKPITTDTTPVSKKHDLDSISQQTTTTSDSSKRQKTTDHANNKHKSKMLFETTVKSVKVRNPLKLQQQCFQCSVALYGVDPDPMEIINSIKNRYDKANDDDQINKYTTISLEYLDKESSEGYILKLLLGDKNDVRKLIGIEVDHLDDSDISTNGMNNLTATTSFIGSDVKLALDFMRSNFSTLESYHHASNGMMITDWIVLALSPIAGKELWLKMMEDQARKLATNGFHHLAATCLLACSKVYDAIHVYRKASMYPEAIAITKVRLPENDPLLPTLYTEWAQQLQTNGQEELAALCYIQSGLPGGATHAINLLGRRGTESSTFWAASIGILIQADSTETLIDRWLTLVNKRKLENGPG